MISCSWIDTPARRHGCDECNATGTRCMTRDCSAGDAVKAQGSASGADGWGMRPKMIGYIIALDHRKARGHRGGGCSAQHVLRTVSLNGVSCACMHACELAITMPICQLSAAGAVDSAWAHLRLPIHPCRGLRASASARGDPPLAVVSAAASAKQHRSQQPRFFSSLSPFVACCVCSRLPLLIARPRHAVTVTVSLHDRPPSDDDRRS